MESDTVFGSVLSAAERTERRAELQAYIDRHQVTPLLHGLVGELLAEMPDNVPAFIVGYMEAHFPDSVPRQPGPAEEKEDTGEELPTSSASETESETDSDDDDDDDYVDELPAPQPTARSRMRRGVVFSEVVHQSGDQDDSVPVHEKGEQELSRLVAYIGKTKLLSHLEREQQRTFALAMFPVSFSQGEHIIHQGADGDNLYIVDEGECSVWIRTGDEEPVKVASYEPGGCFGELALLHNAPRAASVVADTAVTAWAVNRVSFKRIMMSSSLKQQEEYLSFVRRISILDALTDEERLRVASSFTLEHYTAGDIVIRQGDTGDSFFIVRTGEVECSKEVTSRRGSRPGSRPRIRHEVVGTLHPGDYFGEIALLTDQPRQATVKASVDTSCLRLDRHTFKRLMGPLSDVLRRNMETYSAFLGHTI